MDNTGKEAVVVVVEVMGKAVDNTGKEAAVVEITGKEVLVVEITGKEALVVVEVMGKVVVVVVGNSGKEGALDKVVGEVMGRVLGRAAIRGHHNMEKVQDFHRLTRGGTFPGSKGTMKLLKKQRLSNKED